MVVLCSLFNFIVMEGWRCHTPFIAKRLFAILQKVPCSFINLLEYCRDNKVIYKIME